MCACARSRVCRSAVFAGRACRPGLEVAPRVSRRPRQTGSGRLRLNLRPVKLATIKVRPSRGIPVACCPASPTRRATRPNRRRPGPLGALTAARLPRANSAGASLCAARLRQWPRRSRAAASLLLCCGPPAHPSLLGIDRRNLQGRHVTIPEAGPASTARARQRRGPARPSPRASKNHQPSESDALSGPYRIRVTGGPNTDPRRYRPL